MFVEVCGSSVVVLEQRKHQLRPTDVNTQRFHYSVKGECLHILGTVTGVQNQQADELLGRSVGSSDGMWWCGRQGLFTSFPPLSFRL